MQFEVEVWKWSNSNYSNIKLAYRLDGFESLYRAVSAAMNARQYHYGSGGALGHPRLNERDMQVHPTWMSLPSDGIIIRLFVTAASGNRKQLNLNELYRYWISFRYGGDRHWQFGGRHVRNWNIESYSGPVKYTGHSGRNSRRFRSDRRSIDDAASLTRSYRAAFPDEPTARVKPTYGVLNEYDSAHRYTERNWKSQHHGRKAWDKPGRIGGARRNNNLKQWPDTDLSKYDRYHPDLWGGEYE